MTNYHLYRLSASCTHVSALLHALSALRPMPFPSPASSSVGSEDVEPVTSFPCMWKQPKKRKASNMKISDVDFEKYVRGRTKKRKYSKLEEFDPRPVQYRNTAKDNLPSLLESVRGQGLCISLLLDKRLCVTDTSIPSSSTTHIPQLPDDATLNRTITEFLKSLEIDEAEARQIERDTIEQRNSPYWFEVRRFRLTSSVFGTVFRRKPDTPPDKLVLRILRQENFTSQPTEWGIANESVAIEAYKKKQQENGHPDLTVCKAGFVISTMYPYLGATPDGTVYDPSSPNQPYGYVEVKCSYTQRNVTPIEACSSPGFCCNVKSNGGKQCISLRREHPYFCQVQGQMAIGQRPWCDFVVHTTKGTEIQRINFDQTFWESKLQPALTSFYTNYVVHEIVSPMHTVGKLIRKYKYT